MTWTWVDWAFACFTCFTGGVVLGWREARIWNRTRRRIDLQILWPACKRQARGDLEQARCAFIAHMAIDPAWRDFFANENELGDWVRTNLV